MPFCLPFAARSRSTLAAAMADDDDGERDPLPSYTSATARAHEEASVKTHADDTKRAPGAASSSGQVGLAREDTPSSGEIRGLAVAPAGNSVRSSSLPLQLSEKEAGERISKLWAKMEKMDLDVYIVPSEDAHQSEFTAREDRRRAWITGFTGSAGWAVVCRPGGWRGEADEAAADPYVQDVAADANAQTRYPEGGGWVHAHPRAHARRPALRAQPRAFCLVDSRYFIQAAHQLAPRYWRMIKLVRPGDAGAGTDESVGSLDEFVRTRCTGRVGVDPRLVTLATANLLRKALAASSDPHAELVPVYPNLVDAIRPPAPDACPAPIELHPLRFAGESAADKLARIRKVLFPASKPAAVPGPTPSPAYLLPVLPALAWLLNIRSAPPGDVPNVPVIVAYLALTPDAAVLFVDPRKVGPEAHVYLAKLGVAVRPYGVEHVERWVRGGVGKREVCAPAGLSWALANIVGEDNLCIIDCPIEAAKAIKNETEIQGFRNAYLRDGAATVRWMAWLEHAIKVKGRDVGEFEASEKLTAFRAMEQYNRGLAYDNISGSGPNGALPHYSPIQGQDRIIDRKTPYVIDAGGQYLDGTIDTTRTMHFGRPTADQKRAFTRVLQGHIAMETTPFPKGTKGASLDSLARQYLFMDGLNFGHGVGHGIGQYLSVHEGPQGVPSAVAIQVGHLLSNEPGFYLEGQWGIRIESVVVCKEVKTRFDWGGQWLGFERLTRVPIQASLVDGHIMSPEQAAWLKQHNALVLQDVMPLLTRKEDDLARQWLKAACA